MKSLQQYKFLSLVLLLACVLSACSGVPAGSGGQSPQNDQNQEVVFSGTVESIGAGQWTVSGQSISLSSTTADHAANSNDSNADDNVSNSNSNDGTTNANSNENGNDNTNIGPEQEVFGTVEGITAESITINGVIYMISDFTEFKDLIAVGDAVTVHVIVNADGTFTIREIEKSTGVGDDDNLNSKDSNENDDANDDNENGDDNNGNDDDGDDD